MKDMPFFLIGLGMFLFLAIIAAVWTAMVIQLWFIAPFFVALGFTIFSLAILLMFVGFAWATW